MNGDNCDEIRILVAGDSMSLTRDVHFLHLQKDPCLQSDTCKIVANVVTDQEVVTKCRECLPDVVLMVIRNMSCFQKETIRAMKSEHSNLRILILSNKDQVLIQAMRMGVCAYYLRPMTSAKLLDLVERIRKGESALPGPLLKKILMEYKKKDGSKWMNMKLTQRELEILRLIFAKKSTWEIARILQISKSTVSFHISKILKKFNCLNRHEAIEYAIRQHII
ncbi:response regulator transcription factor [Fodinisporobacter ferrooxydans]|uniref:Response regulator transcription factor n=1 Tax=Fodinisporobacter ferrooxydans TaxID=2901836 RepID=A0ABY4CK89_9BACL|nr:response regulator transcription factor [Alicyclobacillaceae bacterium MYW30-H2]